MLATFTVKSISMTNIVFYDKYRVIILVRGIWIVLLLHHKEEHIRTSTSVDPIFDLEVEPTLVIKGLSKTTIELILISNIDSSTNGHT